MPRYVSSRLKFIYLGALILALHYSFTIYINSNFLSEYFSERTISYLYTSGAILTLIAFIISTSLIKRFGNFRVIIAVIFAEIISLLGLFATRDPALIKFFFIIHQALPPLLLMGLDVFLEGTLRTQASIGRIRSMYLTSMNLAFVISPLIVGKIISVSSYQVIYLISALLCALFLFITVESFRTIRTRELKEVNFLESVRTFLKHKDLCRIFIINFLLQSFYAVMVIYTPLYLHNVIGFDWQSIGAIFTVMLIPFVIFEAPLGRMFDAMHTEKDTLIVGFIIMALATVLMFSVTSTSIATWMLLLFFSRMGASFVEVASDYAFFLRISDQDVGLISVNKMTGPLAYIVIPLTIQLFITTLPINYLFLFTGITLSIGTIFSYKLRSIKAKRIL
ncbi:MAG: MFS transporter [Patescibacteria group bacterium]